MSFIFDDPATVTCVPGHLSIDGASAKSAPFGGEHTAEGASSTGWENILELLTCGCRMGGVLKPIH